MHIWKSKHVLSFKIFIDTLLLFYSDYTVYLLKVGSLIKQILLSFKFTRKINNICIGGEIMKFTNIYN